LIKEIKELFIQVKILRSQFFNKYNLHCKFLYIGKNEISLLKKLNAEMNWIEAEIEPKALWGLKVIEVNEESHIGLGIKINE